MSTVRQIRQPKSVAMMTDQELLAAIRARLASSAEALIELGGLVAEARRRGLNLSEFNRGVFLRASQVHAGALSAEMVVAFADHKALLDAMVGVPLERQRALLLGETVAVVESAPDRKEGWRVVLKSLRQLNGPQARQVFDSGQERTPAKQRSYRATHEVAANRVSPRTASAEQGLRIVADLGHGDILVGSHRLKPHQLATALAKLGYSLVKK